MNDPRPGDRACEEMRLMIQADLDGELDAAATAVLAAHVAECPGCIEEQRAVTALSALLRSEAPRHAAPAALRQQIEASLAPRRAAPPRPTGFRRWRPMLSFGGLSFGAGAAVAASLMLLLMLPIRQADHEADHQEAVEAQVVASHIRALQPGHLTDVLSTDKHTVKPWFDGRIDYAPPVYDFKQAGFPLIGARLDYVDGRPVAVLVYAHAKHVIDLYIWPGTKRAPPAHAVQNGYSLLYWGNHGMQCSAISDVEPSALAQFAKLWMEAAS